MCSLMRIITVGEKTMAIREKMSFRDYVLRRMKLVEFQEMEVKDQREVFLQWKHESKDENVNEMHEAQERQFYYHIKNADPSIWTKMESGQRHYLQKRIEWYEHCEQVWKEIETGVFFYGEYGREVKKGFGGER